MATRSAALLPTTPKLDRVAAAVSGRPSSRRPRARSSTSLNGSGFALEASAGRRPRRHNPQAGLRPVGHSRRGPGGRGDLAGDHKAQRDRLPQPGQHRVGGRIEGMAAILAEIQPNPAQRAVGPEVEANRDGQRQGQGRDAAAGVDAGAASPSPGPPEV